METVLISRPLCLSRLAVGLFALLASVARPIKEAGCAINGQLQVLLDGACYDLHMGSRERKPDHQELSILADVVARQFIQRRDLYAKQLEDGSYVSIHRPLQDTHLAAHLRGDMTLGAYVLDQESQGRFLVLDADSIPDFRRLKALAGVLASEGVIGYLEDSRRGGHMWLFLEEPLPGKDIRAFGRRLLEHFRIGGVELFPKQDRLTTGPGSLIRLPFGVHRKSSRRYGFYLPDGQALAPSLREQIHALRAPETISKPFVDLFAPCVPGSQVERLPGTPGRPEGAVSTADENSAPVSERIKVTVSVRQFVLRYVELSKAGKGLCPFHDDHVESFSVNDKSNFWHCFACDTGGSIIDFYMMLQDRDFSTAVSELAEMLL